MINFFPAAAATIKGLTLVGLGIYVGFALVIVRQEQRMADVLEEAFEPILRLLVYIHLLASVGVFFIGFLFL